MVWTVDKGTYGLLPDDDHHPLERSKGRLQCIRRTIVVTVAQCQIKGIKFEWI